MSTTQTTASAQPRTEAVRALMARMKDPALLADLLFLERWEADPAHGAGSVMRVAQIRRALPDLAAAVRAEIAHAR
jgi:hypothetical protein